MQTVFPFSQCRQFLNNHISTYFPHHHLGLFFFHSRNMEQVLLRVDSEPAMVTYGPSGSTQLDTEPIIYLGMV